MDIDRGSTHWEGCWRAHHGCAVAEVERREALADYAQNLIAIWNQPRADTPVGQALHFDQLDSAIARLREAIES